MARHPRRPRPSQDTDEPENPVVKLLFGLYQCLHHLSFLNGEAGNDKRRPFDRKVEELDRFIIPALPTLNTKFKKDCHATNERWRDEQIANLKDHYTWSIDVLKGSISAHFLSHSELFEHLKAARQWAKRNFRKKFQAKIFGEVDQMVQKLISTTVKGPAPGNSNKIPAETKAPASPETPAPQAKKPPAPAGTSAPEVEKTPAPAVDPTPGMGKVPTQAATSTPLKRKRCRRSTGEASSPPVSPSETNSQKRSKTLSYADTAKSPNIRPHAKNTQKDSPSVTKFRKLQNHERGQKMLSVWEIPKVVKDILVLGTSNLARISFVERKDAQVISYSGLKLEPLRKLLAAFKFGKDSKDAGRQPSHVVISVGLCDKGFSHKSNRINLTKVIHEAKRQFPKSKISFYQQPFDPRLSTDDKNTLEKLNGAIEELCKAHDLNCIPRLPKNKFAVVNDQIHWTEDCANATVEHFFQHLKLEPESETEPEPLN